MKKILLLSVALLSQMNFAQISLEKNKLVKDGTKYKMSDYRSVFKNQEALNYFQKSRTNNTLGTIFGAAGGAFMGFGLAKALSGGETKVTTNYGTQTIKQDKGSAWALVGIGAGLVGIGIPFALAAKKNADKAIATENGEATAFQPYFKVESACNGIAMSYNF